MHFNIPWAGEKTFKYKQSSDWFCRNGSNLFRYSNRPFGIFSNAPVSFCIFGNRCGHTGLNLSAIRTPFHGDGARVGLNLEKEKKKFQTILNWVVFFFAFCQECLIIKSKWKFNFVISTIQVCSQKQSPFGNGMPFKPHIHFILSNRKLYYTPCIAGNTFFWLTAVINYHDKKKVAKHFCRMHPFFLSWAMQKYIYIII